MARSAVGVGLSGTCCPHQDLVFSLSLPCPHLRYLCDKVVPGNRVTIMGIYSIKKYGLNSSRGRDRVGVGIRSSYIRVLGIQVDTDGSGELALGPGMALLEGWLARRPQREPRHPVLFVPSSVPCRGSEHLLA